MSTAVKKVTKKVATPRDHPAYADMVKKAIREMKDRKGSSRVAIIKYIRANFKIAAGENVESYVRRSLVAGIKAGRFINSKGTGASGSFKLPEKALKAKKPAKKATKPKKAKTPKKKTPKKSATKKVTKAKSPKAKSAKKAAAPKKVKTPKRAGAKKTPKKSTTPKVKKAKVAKK